MSGLCAQFDHGCRHGSARDLHDRHTHEVLLSASGKSWAPRIGYSTQGGCWGLCHVLFGATARIMNSPGKNLISLLALLSSRLQGLFPPTGPYADPEETAVQRFLEENPAMVPGAWTPGPNSGHWQLHCYPERESQRIRGESASPTNESCQQKST